MSNLDKQIGGRHYFSSIQPVEYIHANDLGFMEGCIVKYATRHKKKNGAEDIRKIIHYGQLILELEYGEKGEKAETRKPVGIEYSASYKPTQSYDWPGPDNEERSVPDFKYSIQYNPSDPSSGGL